VIFGGKAEYNIAAMLTAESHIFCQSVPHPLFWWQK